MFSACSESSDDLSSETEGEGKERGKLLLKVKKEKATADQADVDPVTKLLRVGGAACIELWHGITLHSSLLSSLSLYLSLSLPPPPLPPPG